VLLPTHVPRWLDAESPVAEPLTVVRGTIARHSTLASALEGLLPPAGVHRLVEAARPVYKLHGKPENLIVKHPDCAHDFPDDMRQFAYSLFERHLGG